MDGCRSLLTRLVFLFLHLLLGFDVVQTGLRDLLHPLVPTQANKIHSPCSGVLYSWGETTVGHLNIALGHKGLKTALNHKGLKTAMNRKGLKTALGYKGLKTAMNRKGLKTTLGYKGLKSAGHKDSVPEYTCTLQVDWLGSGSH